MQKAHVDGRHSDRKKYIKTFKLMTYRFPSRQNHKTDFGTFAKHHRKHDCNHIVVAML